VGTFMTLTNVGAGGTIEDVRIASSSGFAMCLYEKLHALQLAKATPFPPPPQAPYWVRLDLDWAEFAPAAGQMTRKKVER
jgi:outer membrane biosynthesis protein TonB